MKRTSLRIMTSVITVMLTAAVLSGCKKPADPSVSGNQNENKAPDKLTYWVPLNSNVAKFAKNLGETEFAKQLQKDTNTEIEFKHPPVGQEADQFKLLMASGDLPDIIENGGLTGAYPGGIDKAIEDKVILSLNSVIEKNSPNLKKHFTANPNVAKMAKTDSGNYYCFPFIRGDDTLMSFFGPIVRQDWLDELGLKAPTTIDELTNVLKQFKEQKKAEVPMTFQGLGHLTAGNDIIGAYKIGWGMYAKENKITYGFYQPEYKDFLAQMRKWYQEKLLDQDFLTQDAKAYEAKITGDKTGYFMGYGGSTLKRYDELMKQQKPKFTLAGAPHLVKAAGEKPTFGQKDLPFTNWGAMISAKSKNVEAAARLLDYGYSEKGHILMNWGVEGQSYKLEGGKPQALADKWAADINVGYNFTRGSYNGPLIQVPKPEIPAHKGNAEAVKLWSNFQPSSVIPPLTPTADESTKVAKLNSEIDTFAREKFAKYIMGQEGLESFDKYIDQLKKMNIDELIKLNQAAYDRAMKR